jgi:virulence-associated protein VagC
MSKHVNVEPQDSVRIQYTHKAVTIPASLIFEVDQKLKQLEQIGHALIVYPSGLNKWIAECGGAFVGSGDTAMQAIANMYHE